MASIALVNPRHRKRRRMTAKQAMYFGKRRSRRRSRRTSSHRRRRHSFAAPAPRRRHRRRRHSFARRARRSLRRFARHEGGSLSLRGFNFNSFLRGTLVPSAVGAAGALGLDVVLGYATPMLPAMLTDNAAGKVATRLAGAVALGMIASAVTRDRRLGEQVMAGAITVMAYGFAKTLIQGQFPSLPLSEYEGVGAYVSGVGYAGPALAFPDRSALSMYVGRSGTWNPSINAAMTGATTRGRSTAMHGAGGEFTEGGYQY